MPRGDLFAEIGPFETGYLPLSAGHVMYWEQVGKVVTLTSTYDHRVIQGAESGEFLGRIEALLSGADGFYADVFESLGLAAPVADEVPASLLERALPAGAVPEHDRVLLVAVQGATSLVQAHSPHGHLGAHLDPLGTPPPGDPAMKPETYDLTPELMARIPSDLPAAVPIW